MSTPTLPSDHDEYEALAVAWAVSALEPADQVIFEAHRDGCERCPQAAYEALDIAAELAYAVPDVGPPAGLRERVLDAARTHSSNGRPAAGRDRSDVVPDAQAALDSPEDRSDDRSAAAPASGGDSTGSQGRAAGAASDRDVDRSEGRRAAGPAAGGDRGPSGGPRMAGPALSGDLDRLGSRGAAGPIASDGLGPSDGRRTAKPAAGGDPDPSGGRRTAKPAAGGDLGSSSGRRAAGPALGADLGMLESRRGAKPASGEDLGRSGGRPVRGPRSGEEAARRPRGAGPGRMARAMRGPRRLTYALAAAVLAVASAVTTWQITRPAPVTDRIAALSAASGTIATVVAHQHGADVVTDMLPPNTGRGTAYYIWGVPAEDGGTPQVVGTFEVTAAGLHSYPVRLTRPLDGYPVLAISEENAGSMPAAPSSVLGRGALGG